MGTTSGRALSQTAVSCIAAGGARQSTPEEQHEQVHASEGMGTCLRQSSKEVRVQQMTSTLDCRRPRNLPIKEGLARVAGLITLLPIKVPTSAQRGPASRQVRPRKLSLSPKSVARIHLQRGPSCRRDRPRKMSLCPRSFGRIHRRFQGGTPIRMHHRCHGWQGQGSD